MRKSKPIPQGFNLAQSARNVLRNWSKETLAWCKNWCVSQVHSFRGPETSEGRVMHMLQWHYKQLWTKVYPNKELWTRVQWFSRWILCCVNHFSVCTWRTTKAEHRWTVGFKHVYREGTFSLRCTVVSLSELFVDGGGNLKRTVR